MVIAQLISCAKNVEVLTKSGADVNVTDFNKETALTHALKCNSHTCVGIELNVSSGEGESVLHLSID